MQQRNKPRWDHPEDYDYTKTHTKRDWGWEFIRRSPVYIDEWKKNLKKFRKERLREELLFYFSGFDPARLFTQKDWEGPEYTVKNKEEIKRRIAVYESHGYNLTNPDKFESFQLGCHGWSLFGITSYQDPDAKKLVGCNLLTRDIFSELQCTLGPTTVKVEENQCAAIIDLLVPLIPQIENIKKMAEELQAEHRKDDKDKLPTVTKSKREISDSDRARWMIYIRCLDAHDLGIKRQIAAQIIFTQTISKNEEQSPEEKWDETLKQAKPMREIGWRALMF